MSITKDLEIVALTPEERERKERELAEAEASDPNVCIGCGS